MQKGSDKGGLASTSKHQHSFGTAAGATVHVQ